MIFENHVPTGDAPEVTEVNNTNLTQESFKHTTSGLGFMKFYPPVIHLSRKLLH